MPATLYIAAKAPRPGLAKTRLGRDLGHAAAALLYRAFLYDLAQRFRGAPFAVGWYITPPDAWNELNSIIGSAHAPARILVQPEGDWTARQRLLFQGAAERGEEHVILVASDSPQLEVAHVADAFQQLDQHEVVLGPTDDGGYYLIGMRGYHDVFGTIRMSTRTVLDQLITRTQEQGLSLGLVAPLFDIDHAADLIKLRRIAAARDDLPATRAALRELDAAEAQRAARPTRRASFRGEA